MSKNLSRRAFLRMASALSASGALAWKSDLQVEAQLPLTESASEPETQQATCSFDHTKPFYPYRLEPGCEICDRIKREIIKDE